MFSTVDHDPLEQTTAAEGGASTNPGAAHIVWGLLILAACSLYVHTMRPEWSVALVALKFGWNRLQLGWWLMRRDESILRGLAAGLLCLAWGVLRTAWVSLLLGWALYVGGALLCGQAINRFDQVGIVFYSSAMAFQLLMFSALIIARATGVKLWISQELMAYWRHDIWPPAPRDKNDYDSLVLVLTVTAMVSLSWLLVRNPAPGVPGVPLWTFLYSSVISLIFYCHQPAFRSKDCWPPESVTRQD